ncbi:MAG TPA: ABC transporter substrate-binding protein [Vicinamibacterales bacterium]|nr:ABC transporter substrate-binding protein [Vicinamibacterales bacterium]
MHFALLTSLTACSGDAVSDPQVITVAVRSGPTTLDPRQGNDESSQRVAQLVFSPLMEWGDDLRVHPGLAVRLDNPDPLTYIAHLRRGVMFHDGHELTSRDVVYTFSAFLDPAFVSPFKGAYKVLKAVRALDDYSVQFTLEEPFAAFPVQLVQPPIVPDNCGDTMRTFPIGTGPYRFVRYDADDRVVLSAFEGFWDGLPNNAGIVMKVIPDDTMRGLDLRKGATDLVVNDLPPDIVYQLRKDTMFRVEASAGLDFSYIGFNLRDPVLENKRVRQAIGYAIDRDAIIKYMRRGLARPAVGLIPDQAWAFEPDVRRFTHDPGLAKQLLDEAGHRDPDGDGPQPRLRLSMRISTNEETRLQSTVIQQDLRKVGIELDLRSYEFATFYADVLRGNFQLFSLTWTGGALADPDMLRRVFHSQQIPPAGFNRGHYRNPEVDRLIDLATTATGEAARKVYYRDAQKLIAEDAPYIPIWNRTNVIVAQRALDGLHLNATGDFQALKDVKRAAR